MMEASSARTVPETVTTGVDVDLWLVPPPAQTLTTAELADCTCPEFCERDHDRD